MCLSSSFTIPSDLTEFNVVFPRSQHFIVPLAHRIGAFASSPDQKNTPSVLYLVYCVFHYQLPFNRNHSLWFKVWEADDPIQWLFHGAPDRDHLFEGPINLFMKGNLNP